MENVILIVHMILALCLIGIVLLQRSEGGGLGSVGGGAGGLVSSRGAATALGKLTWAFAIAFIITSITLTILAAQKSSSDSVLSGTGEISTDAPADTNPNLPPLAPVDDLLPPPAEAPTTPRAD